MKIKWQISYTDIKKARTFYNEHKNNTFVQMRNSLNLRKLKRRITKADFWRVMVGCLLTTQQRSGPDSPVSRFLLTKPFPLDYETCCRRRNLEAFVRKTLGAFGGIRFSTKVGKELANNLKFLEQGGWDEVFEHLENVRLKRRGQTERQAAEFIDNNLKGFGPKQSRNLLQGLHLSRYETPIDSRVIKWLNDFGFPVELTANTLGDPSYYNFVSDGFQQLCKACHIKPCSMDAAIFSSFDKGTWTKATFAW